MTIEAYTINSFCAAHNFSRATYYNIKRAGKGPREMQVGNVGVRISREAAEAWRREREEESETAARETAAV